jgi:predicted cupin superfamily sugar epimerase
MNTAEYWIQHLQLTPHPEGGFYREEYRSSIEIEPGNLPIGYKSVHRVATSIYFLLRSADISRLHRLKSDEIWYFHAGSPIKVIMIDTEGKKHTHILGANHEKAEHFSLLIPAGFIFCAEILQPDSFGLVSCVVAPGFEFEDFEIFDKEDLIQAYPKHKELIDKFG